MAAVSLRNLVKRFGADTVVDGISLDIADGEFLVLVGPSGCGKSTTLRMVAGLETASAGEIWIGDTLTNTLHPADRDVAMVFQSYALYPHMSVFDNLAYGLRRRGVPRAEIAARVARTAELLKLSELLRRRPAQLSGGQRQRVALGRAIIREPAVFLMDEPLSNLDAKLRVETRAELLRLHARLGATTIYVTHDQVEAMTMGQRIAVMNQGRIEQVGPPLALYHAPASLFVAGFLGTPEINRLPGRMEPAGEAGWRFVGEPWTFALPGLRLNGAAGAVVLGVRPQHLLAGALAAQAGSRTIALGTATVEMVEHYGPESFATVSAGAASLTAEVPSLGSDRPGSAVPLAVDPAHIHVFDAASGRRLDLPLPAAIGERP